MAIQKNTEEKDQATLIKSRTKKPRSDKGIPQNTELYDKLVLIYSLPRDDAEKLHGFKDLSKWCRANGYSYDTAYKYIHNEDFKKIVGNRRFAYGFELEQDFLQGMRRGVRSGNANNLELYANYYKGWSRKNVNENIETLRFDDVLEGVKTLNDERQQYFFNLLDEILGEIQDARREQNQKNNS